MGLADDKTLQRNQRLDELVSLTQAWSKATQADVQNRASQLTRLLQGRGVGLVAQTTAGAASSLIVTEVSQFLTGL